MRPLLFLVAAVIAATLAMTAAEGTAWLEDHLALVATGFVAAGLVAFSWWDLWSTRRQW